MRRRILQPPSLVEILAELALLDDQQFIEISNEIRDIDSFDTDNDRITKISEKTNIDRETIRLMFSGLAYLYRNIHKIKISDEKLSEVIRDLIDTLIVEEEATEGDSNFHGRRTELLDRLNVLLARQDNATNFAKYERLRWGFLPVVLGVDSFLDLRPNFNEKLDAIEELIPLLQFNIATDSPNEIYRNIVLQVDARGLAVLRKAVERAEEKLLSLHRVEPLNSMISKRRLQKK